MNPPVGGRTLGERVSHPSAVVASWGAAARGLNLPVSGRALVGGIPVVSAVGTVFPWLDDRLRVFLVGAEQLLYAVGYPVLPLPRQHER